MKVLRYLAALAVVVTVFVAGGMAAASAQETSMQLAMEQQTAQQVALKASVVQEVAGVQGVQPAADDACTVTGDGSCSTGQGIGFTILPPGVTPPPSSPPPSVDGNKQDDDTGNKGTNVGGKGLVKTGPSATGWAAIVGIAFVQVGMVVLIRGQRWTRSQLELLS